MACRKPGFKSLHREDRTIAAKQGSLVDAGGAGSAHVHLESQPEQGLGERAAAPHER